MKQIVKRGTDSQLKRSWLPLGHRSGDILLRTEGDCSFHFAEPNLPRTNKSLLSPDLEEGSLSQVMKT